MDSEKERPRRIIGSEDTTARLSGIADRMTALAQSDILVVTKEDLQKTSEASFAPISARGKLSEIFRQAGVPEGYFNDLSLEVFAQSVLKQDATAISVDHDMDGKPDLGIITAPDLSMTSQKFVSMMTGLPEESVHSLPGTGADYLNMVMLHESRHISQPGVDQLYNSMPFPYELDADRHAIVQGKDMHSQGAMTDPRVLGVFHDMRVLGGLGQDTHVSQIRSIMEFRNDMGISSHSTHLALSPDGVLPESAAEDYSATVNVNTVISGMSGAHFLTEGLKQLAQSPPVPENERIFQNPLDALEVASNPTKMIEMGSAALQGNVPLAYEALKVARDKGYIADGTPEARYADKVMNFFEKHVDMTALNSEQLESARTFFSAAPAADAVQSAPAPGQEPEQAPSIQRPIQHPGLN